MRPQAKSFAVEVKRSKRFTVSGSKPREQNWFEKAAARVAQPDRHKAIGRSSTENRRPKANVSVRILPDLTHLATDKASPGIDERRAAKPQKSKRRPKTVKHSNTTVETKPIRSAIKGASAVVETQTVGNATEESTTDGAHDIRDGA